VVVAREGRQGSTLPANHRRTAVQSALSREEDASRASSAAVRHECALDSSVSCWGSTFFSGSHRCMLWLPGCTTVMEPVECGGRAHKCGERHDVSFCESVRWRSKVPTVRGPAWPPAGPSASVLGTVREHELRPRGQEPLGDPLPRGARRVCMLRGNAHLLGVDVRLRRRTGVASRSVVTWVTRPSTPSRPRRSGWRAHFLTPGSPCAVR
jgi:hypothetical protein